MNIEYPAAFNFIFTDDLFLLNADKALYALAEKDSTEIETPKPAFNYLGGNKKNFLVITHYADEEHVAQPHLQALENTLKRLNYSIDDIAVLNLHRYPDILPDDLRQYFSYKKMLILGSNATPQGLINLQLNKITETNGIKMLCTHSFAEMMTDNEKKKAFWEQIKQF